MLAAYKKLDIQIHDLQEQIKELPNGELSCACNGKYYKWYQCVNHTNTYIPKSNTILAKQLALKKYLCSLLDDLSHEKRAIQFYLEHHATSSKAERILLHPEYKSLLTSEFQPVSQDLITWMNSPYERNSHHPEHLVHKSSSGNLLRSKSESIIDMLLYTHKIPFRYECALSLGETTIFPDFTIRHPKTGTTYYWEHFGLMDNPTYSQNAFAKLQLYATHGILPSIHLITTYETKEHPLSFDTAETIIKQYFLE